MTAKSNVPLRRHSAQTHGNYILDSLGGGQPESRRQAGTCAAIAVLALLWPCFSFGSIGFLASGAGQQSSLPIFSSRVVMAHEAVSGVMRKIESVEISDASKHQEMIGAHVRQTNSVIRSSHEVARRGTGNKDEPGQGWLRFLGQISCSAKWICQPC
jgi:hypothetical protein